jgi:virulence-associated protein VapD
LETVDGNGPNNAHGDIQRQLSSRGFEWMQGCNHFGGEAVNAMNCVTTVQEMAKNFSWFSPIVHDIRMLCIEEVCDRAEAIEPED